MERPRTVKCPAGVRLVGYLRKNECGLRTPCGGHGSCGKCRVKVLKGTVPVNGADRIHLSEKQLAEGIRLGCQIFTKEDILIELIDCVS